MQTRLDHAIGSALSTLLRSVRHPDSGLSALLAVIAMESDSRGVGVLELGDHVAELIAVGGREASRMGPAGSAPWAGDRFNGSGGMTAGPEDDGPWVPGDRVEWRSVPGRDAVLSLVAYGEATDPAVVDELSGPVFLLTELMTARRATQALSTRLTLERQDRALLSASLHHDLRTPLSGILGFARVLSQQEDLSSAEAAEILDLMVSEAEHMTELVSEGLRREELGPDAPLKLQTTDPRLIAESVAEVARHSRQGEIVLGVEQCSIVTDPHRLTRSLLNLVDNAIKYSPAGEPVRIGGTRDGGHFKFVVSDTGPGVPDDMVPTLFQPFSTDPSRDDGTGIGLHSVATIADELGGRVTYARHRGWTSFSLWVSADGPEGGPRGEGHQPAEGRS